MADPEHASFEVLYREHFTYVYAFVAGRLAGSAGAAADVVQETFAAALEGFPRFRRDGSVRTWLCGIARKKIADRYRKEIREEKRLARYANEGGAADRTDDRPESVLIRRSELEAVTSVLSELKPLSRYCLVMKYLDGLSTRRIARVLGKTEKAVEHALARARSEFRTRYESIGGSRERNVRT